jgi:hypothetical protein
MTVTWEELRPGEPLPEGVHECASPDCKRLIGSVMRQCCSPCINRAAGSPHTGGKHARTCTVRHLNILGVI